MVVVLQAVPVPSELFQTVLVDVCQPVHIRHISAIFPCAPYDLPHHSTGENTRIYIHTLRTPRHFAALLQTVNLALAVGLGLALHEVIIVGLAASANEVCRAEQGSRGGANLLDFWDRRREGSGVDEGFAGESAVM